MPTVNGLHGTLYALDDKPFAGGGEGSIYNIKGFPDHVAKLYHEKMRTGERHKKLTVMVDAPPSWDTNAQLAWPTDVLYESGRFCGFVMSRLKSIKKLNEVYSYDKRAGRPWTIYIAIAKNLAAAIDSVHHSGHVCGDLNPNNICVNPANGLVTLVDTDSYHITDSKTGKIYRCEVGMVEFIPKNLQNINFKAAPLPTFTKESDLFTLGILIFSLLMNGAHPFACSVSTSARSGQGFQPVNNILNGLYPYESNTQGISIPKYAPAITALPPELRKLFTSAFLTKPGEKRPDTVMWYNALDAMCRSLTTCGKDSSHIYYSGSPQCPWCAVSQNMQATASKLKLIGAKRPQLKQVPIPGIAPVTGTAQTPKPTTATTQTTQTAQPARVTGSGGSSGFSSFLSFLSGIYFCIPIILIIIFALAYGGLLGFLLFKFVSKLTLPLGIIAAACGVIGGIGGTVAAADEYKSNGTFTNFIVFFIAAPITAVMYAGGLVIGAAMVILGISLVLSIGSWLLGLMA